MNWLTSMMALSLGLAMPAAQAQETAHDLRIEISGAEAFTGQVLVSLFEDETSYMKKPVAEHIEQVDGQGNAIVLIPDLEVGDYAVAVVYDRDSDGKLDTGLFGIPSEKIGFSNNARGRMGPASWENARFDFSPETSSIQISLGKAKRN